MVATVSGVASFKTTIIFIVVLLSIDNMKLKLLRYIFVITSTIDLSSTFCTEITFPNISLTHDYVEELNFQMGEEF